MQLDFHNVYPVLTGLLSVLVAGLIAHRFSRQRDKEHEQWQNNQESIKRDWEAQQARRRQEWEDTQRERDEQLRKELQTNDQRWHAHMEKEQREWEEAKTQLKELRETLTVKTPDGTVIKGELDAWAGIANILHAPPQSIFRRAQGFAKVAGLDSNSVCDMFLFEPIEIDTSKLIKNLETELNITVGEYEVPSVLTKLGFERKAKGWVLNPPQLSNLTPLDFDVLKP